MLTLGRRQGEVVVIDGQIIVKVVGIRGNRVVLGFEAPPHVGIRRGELAEAGWPYSAQPTAVEPADGGSEPGAIEDRHRRSSPLMAKESDRPARPAYRRLRRI
jgi:carbon storage regulator CsrA